MDLSFLPYEYIQSLKNIKFDKLYELRIRQDYPVIVNVMGKEMWLGINGITLLKNQAIIATKAHIELIIKSVTEFSPYAHNDRIKQGFLVTSGGIRIGLAGECVFEKGNIVTIKNVNSLNIRIPHLVLGCSKLILEKILTDRLYNTLIISPPFCGKTTMLKDIAIYLNKLNLGAILIIDERGEFSVVKGENIDTIKFSDKLYAFEYGIRSLSPKIVITDELSSKFDWDCVRRAANSGVTIIASCHGYTIDDVKKKDYFNNDVFERYAVLQGDKPGIIKDVYNGEFIKL